MVPAPAALLAEALLLAADDHHRRLGVHLADPVPPVVLQAPAEVGPAPVDGAGLRAAAAGRRAGPPPTSGRSRRPPPLDQPRGEILEPRLGVCGGGGGRRARERQHGRAGSDATAARPAPHDGAPEAAAQSMTSGGERNLFPTKKPSDVPATVIQARINPWPSWTFGGSSCLPG